VCRRLRGAPAPAPATPRSPPPWVQHWTRPPALPPVLPRPRVRQCPPDRPPTALELPRQRPHSYSFPKVPPADTLNLSHLDHASAPLAASCSDADNVEEAATRSRWSPVWVIIPAPSASLLDCRLHQVGRTRAQGPPRAAGSNTARWVHRPHLIGLCEPCCDRCGRRRRSGQDRDGTASHARPRSDKVQWRAGASISNCETMQ
jgi:hypothetical protein